MKSMKTFALVLTNLITVLCVCGCNNNIAPTNPADEIVVTPITKTTPISSSEILQCSGKNKYAYNPLSPNGSYLVNFLPLNHSGERLSSLVAKPQQVKHYSVESTKLNLENIQKASFRFKVGCSKRPCSRYFWSKTSGLIYRPKLNRTAIKPEWLSYDPFIQVISDISSKELWGEFASTPRKFQLNQYATQGLYTPTITGWRLNTSNEAIIREVHLIRQGNKTFYNNAPYGYSKSTKIENIYTYVQIGTHGKPLPYSLWPNAKDGNYEPNPFPPVQGSYKEVFKYDRLKDKVDIIMSNHFRTAENRSANPIDGDLGIQHFYYLSNVDRNHVALLRYDDKIGEGVISEHYAPAGESVTHVSTNRDGSELYWAITEEGMPKYHFFSDKARALFKLIDLKTPHRSEILSIDSAGRMVIIKRESMAKGLEYLLVDTQEKAGRVLSSCPESKGGIANGMPWADVQALDFTASDGEQIWNFLYSVPSHRETNTPIPLVAHRPLIVYVHGGPSAHHTMDWSNLIIKGLVDRGYNVLVVNYRGSTGYGRKFREEGWQNFERARLDVIEAAQFAIKTGIADTDQIAVMGNSYGGYLTMAIAALDEHPFKVAVSRNGIPNLVTFLEQSFIRSDGKRFTYNAVSDVFGDVNDENNRTYLTKNSPTSGAAIMTTPLLIAHAKSDDKVPFNQGQKFFNTLAETRPDLTVNFLPLRGGHNFSNLDEMDKYLDQADWFIKQAYEKKN